MQQPAGQPAEQPAQGQPAPQQAEDPFAKLKQLKELLDMGVITQEDFDKTKGNILGGLGG
jgi:membrane protease subunit (stomatin/prohibitin family)